MRPFEIILAVALLFYLVWIISKRYRNTLFSVFPYILILVMALQILIEKTRWQMNPLYILTIAISLIVLIQRRLSISKWITVPALILTIPAIALPILLPIPQIPAASGPYPVGTMTFMLTDSSRREIYSNDPTAPRKFLIQVWYPASPRVGDIHAPWMPDANIYAPAISNLLGLPNFFLSHLQLVTTPAYENSPLAASFTPYPMIIFSHGWKGFRAQNTRQMLELASHGYVVIGMEHTYGAAVTVFPDGTIAPNNPSALPDGAPDDVYDAAARKLVNQWSGDIGYALGFMKSQNEDSTSPFYNHLDLNRVGVFGHSTGGGAAIEFCATDSRCKAGLTEDAFMTPVSVDVLNHGPQQPFFFMFSVKFPTAKNTRLFDQLYATVPQSDRAVTILGTAHYDFTDLPMLSPLAPQLGLKGPINGQRVVEIVDDYLLAFFDQTLKGQPTALFDGPSSQFPEVRFDH
jgi:predicted dienelactone hydrolase